MGTSVSLACVLAGHRLAVHFHKNGTLLPNFSVLDHELPFDTQLAAFLTLPLVCSVCPQQLTGEPTFIISSLLLVSCFCTSKSQ